MTRCLKQPCACRFRDGVINDMQMSDARRSAYQHPVSRREIEPSMNEDPVHLRDTRRALMSSVSKPLPVNSKRP